MKVHLNIIKLSKILISTIGVQLNYIHISWVILRLGDYLKGSEILPGDMNLTVSCMLYLTASELKNTNIFNNNPFS